MCSDEASRLIRSDSHGLRSPSNDVECNQPPFDDFHRQKKRKPSVRYPTNQPLGGRKRTKTKNSNFSIKQIPWRKKQNNKRNSFATKTLRTGLGSAPVTANRQVETESREATDVKEEPKSRRRSNGGSIGLDPQWFTFFGWFSLVKKTKAKKVKLFWIRTIL